MLWLVKRHHYVVIVNKISQSEGRDTEHIHAGHQVSTSVEFISPQATVGKVMKCQNIYKPLLCS